MIKNNWTIIESIDSLRSKVICKCGYQAVRHTSSIKLTSKGCGKFKCNPRFKNLEGTQLGRWKVLSLRIVNN